MAIPNDNSTREETIKSSFMTREGNYKLMTLSEYSRPNKLPHTPQNNSAGQGTVRVSFLTVKDDPAGVSDRICFNVGRELYVYPYKGVKKAADLNKPIDKRVYKGTCPTCHDFNEETATAEGCNLLIGFTAGQIQLIDPFRKDMGDQKLFNEERQIDKTRVTCIRWVPQSDSHFLVSHASGYLYLYHKDLPCTMTSPTYTLQKQGDGFCVHLSKNKSVKSNPLARWTVTNSEMGINEFTFSPNHDLLAIVCQDGFLKIFNYEQMEMVSFMRSFFGGLLCLAWSPDAKYVVTGGEDDLVNVFSVQEKRVVGRGQAHKSWVSQVAFDPYTSNMCDMDLDMIGSEEDIDQHTGAAMMDRGGAMVSTSFASHNSSRDGVGGNVPNANMSSYHHQMSSSSLQTSYASKTAALNRAKRTSFSSQSLAPPASYRFGSVGHDTQLCLWDLTDDILKHSNARVSNRNSQLILPPVNSTMSQASNSSSLVTTSSAMTSNDVSTVVPGGVKFGTTTGASAFKDSTNQVPLNVEKPPKTHRKAFSLGGSKSKQNSNPAVLAANAVQDKVNTNTINPMDPVRLLGTGACPRMDQVYRMEPLIVKRISHERLTVLVFREDCFVTACQEGFVYTWARPGKAALNDQHLEFNRFGRD